MNNIRMASWWVVWEDLKWPDNDVYDKIIRRADLMAESNVNTAIIFGAHFRWDFMPIWDCLHDYMRTVADELHKRGIKLIDHHSSVLVHRHSGREEMRNVKIHSGPHLPFSPSYEAAASWTYNGSYLNDWRMIDTRTKDPVYLPGYTAEQFCFNNSDFVEAYLKYVKMLVDETNIDGLMCDDAIYFNGFNSCVCQSCRDKFKRLYGHDLPESDDYSFWGNWKKQAWRDWIDMRYTSNGDFLEKVRGILPDGFNLMSCCSGSSSGWSNHTGQDVRHFNRGCNWVHLELCGNTPPVNDPDTLNDSIVEKLIMSSHHLADAKTKGLTCIGLGFGFYESSANIIWALNKMMGSSCWFSTLKARLGLPDSMIADLPDDAAATAKAFTYEFEHSEIFDSSLVPQVAVYFSYNTRNKTLFGDLEQGYGKDYVDTLSKFFHSGISSETILELPDNTKDHSCIVLASVLCLSDQERSTLRKYMAAGGVVIATGPCGFYNGEGDPAEDSFLSEYKINSSFVEPQMDDDFWDGNWRVSTGIDACIADSKWHHSQNGFLWHPNRLQDDVEHDLIKVIKPFLKEVPVEILESKGYLTTLHQSNRDPEAYIVQLLSAEYDVTVNEELEQKRKHRSRVNLITDAKPVNTAKAISIKANRTIEDFEAYTPFNEDGDIKITSENGLMNITFQNDCTYLLLAVKMSE